MKRKVFGIGFHKTGTTTLKVALEMLGYRVTGANGVDDPDIAANLHAMVDALAEQFDAFQDNPWPLVYARMDERRPGSKFILTVRDADKWIASNVEHFGTEVTPMRRLIYGAGCPKGNEALYVERMTRHNLDVQAYFENRPNDLLVIDFERDARWEPLCRFLEEPVPATPFPHANKGSARQARRQRAEQGLVGKFARLVGLRG